MKYKKFLLINIIGISMISSIMTSYLYKFSKKTTRGISRDFANWGEEFV